MSSVAKKYAKALFEVYQIDQLEAKAEALSVFSELWMQDANLSAYFLNPSISSDDKQATLGQICTMLSENDSNFSNFCNLLLENNRLTEIKNIAEEFMTLLNELRKQLTLEITTANEIDQQEKDEIFAQLKNDFGDMLSVDWKVLPEIIGGMTVKSGDRLLDSSVKGSLEKIKNSLMA